MSYFEDFVTQVGESFEGLFKMEEDSALTEAENIERVVEQTALAASLVSIVVPIPGSSLFLLTPIQAKMALHIGKLKGFEVNRKRAEEIVVEIAGVAGITVTSTTLIAGLASLVPIIGGLLTFPLVYATTFGIGKVVDYYFECLRQGFKPPADVMRDIFVEEFKVGKKRGESLDRNDIRAQAEELKRKVAARDPSLKSDGSAAVVTPPPRPEPARPEPEAKSRPQPSPPPPRQKIKIELPDRDVEERRDEIDAPEVGDPYARAGTKTIGPPPEVSVRERESGPAPTPAAPEPAPGNEPTPASAGSSQLLDQLERLARLREAGALSEAEFEQAKQKLLA